jgi:hypothetical protein
MGGHIAFSAFSMYHATKWSIEGFYESLANCSAREAGARRRQALRTGGAGWRSGQLSS